MQLGDLNRKPPVWSIRKVASVVGLGKLKLFAHLHLIIFSRVKGGGHGTSDPIVNTLVGYQFRRG